MEYKELLDEQLWEALDNLGNLTPKDLTLVSEEFMDPRELLLTLGFNPPKKQLSPLEYLNQEQEYPWEELNQAIVPPVVVIDGVLIDGWHRCMLAYAFGEFVKAKIFVKNK